MAQADLAQLIGVRENSIGRIERGGFVPKTVRVLAIAEVFGVSLDYLVRGEEPENGNGAPAPRPPSGLAAYLASHEAEGLAKAEVEALGAIGRALERAGRAPTPHTYAAMVGIVRMTPAA